MEMLVAELEEMRPPRPIPKIDRSDRFFYRAASGLMGATGFFVDGVADPDKGSGRSFFKKKSCG